MKLKTRNGLKTLLPTLSKKKKKVLNTCFLNVVLPPELTIS